MKTFLADAAEPVVELDPGRARDAIADLSRKASAKSSIKRRNARQAR
jgi:hypothetical protein